MQCPVTLPVPELDRRGSSPVLLVTAAMGVRLLSPHTSHPAHGRSCWPLIHFFSPSPSHPPASLTWVVATAFPVGSHSHPRPWIVCSPHTSHCDPCKTGRNSSLSCSNLPAASHLPLNEIPSPPGAIQPNQLLFPMASLLSFVSRSAPAGCFCHPASLLLLRSQSTVPDVGLPLLSPPALAPDISLPSSYFHLI